MLSLKYTLKVWFSAVFLAPALLLLKFWNESMNAQIGNYYALVAATGLILSLPGGLCFWLGAHAVVYDLGWKKKLAKTTLSLLAILLTLASFFLYGLLGDNLLEAAVYAIAVIVSLWIYKLPEATNYMDMKTLKPLR